MTKEVTLRQAGGSVSATLPKDMADDSGSKPAIVCSLSRPTGGSC